MVTSKTQSTTESQQALYIQHVQQTAPTPPRLQNGVRAFVIGGLICVVGELITDFWAAVLRIPHQRAGEPAVATMIFLGSLLTGLGYFDKIARFGGAGLAVPVTGFANAMSAAALEFKREGLVFGVGGRMFQLAGAVIVFGVVTAFVVGIVAALAQIFR